jgi:hypothetical protein
VVRVQEIEKALRKVIWQAQITKARSKGIRLVTRSTSWADRVVLPVAKGRSNHVPSGCQWTGCRQLADLRW